MSTTKIIALCIAIAVTAYVVGASTMDARGPAQLSSSVPVSVFLNALSTGGTLAGPGLVSDDPSGSGRFVIDDNGASSGQWISIQNTGDTPITIDRNGANVIGVQPGQSEAWEFTAGFTFLNYAGDGSGTHLEFVWVVR